MDMLELMGGMGTPGSGVGEAQSEALIATDGGGTSSGPVRKEQANYRPAAEGEPSCEQCAHFLPPEGCTEVMGQISASGVSDLFEPASMADDDLDSFLFNAGI